MTAIFDWRLTPQARGACLEALLALGEAGIRRRADLLGCTRLWTDGTVAVHYAPFHHVNADAKVMLVGLTPGLQQMELACATAVRQLSAGRSHDEAFRGVKEAASFAGSMRGNLIAMLDGIGLHSALGLPSSADLFGSRRDLLHTTSALRFPVLVHGRNYTGHAPKPLEHPTLRAGIETLLTDELRAVPAALVVPLGMAAEAAIQHLMTRGVVDASRCAFGFPHPSGANGHRGTQFAANQERLRAAVTRWLRR
jgi:hypothetical protein